MTDDHEDYLPGEAPAAHKVSHQDGGTDEISLAGLSGEPEDLAAHILLPTVHQDAPGLIETHRLIPGAHHAKYTDGDAVDAMGVLGDGNPLNHDKAAEWGATEHTAIGDAAPHHAKYTDGDAVDAMGVLGDGNPLNHDRAAEWGAAEHEAIGDAAPHHAKYTDLNARASINHVHDSTGKITQDLDVNTHKILNVVDPVTDQGSATKKYVDDKMALFAKIKTGTYTGDGTVSQAITGIGFRVKWVVIYPHILVEDAATYMFIKLDRAWGDFALQSYSRVVRMKDNRINSLDADGFTVDDDGTDVEPNKSGIVYDYLALG